MGEGPDPRRDRFLRACRLEPVDRTPVWFMRQAGRYLPEYRELRRGRDVLEMCRTPELVVEATLLPVRRLGVDAAILFSDIMVPVAAVGVEVRIQPGVGPVVPDPFRAPADLRRLRDLVPDRDVPYVLEAVRELRRQLEVPLIGFAGAPFTLASYLVEGGPSRHHERTKAFMHTDPEGWRTLMRLLATATASYLRAQVESGAQAVQVFDSWVGTLDPDDYAHFVAPHMRTIFDGLADLGVPRIHFGVGTSELLAQMRDVGADVVGVDWRVPLHLAWERVGFDVGVQGNLDPAVCLAPWEAVQSKALGVLRRAAGRPGHVFNLGHGVLPDTPVENLQRLVELVHERTAREGGQR
ncbi:MAG TPA: uroporphyrinogen decarboxylase [Actinomycetota bacterium]|nr:uroporphyrinogen decarboxylase [Actinomycetota bacterium]